MTVYRWPVPDPIFRRHPGNPLISADDLPGRWASAFNPGATLTDDGVVVLVRGEDRRGLSSIFVARSADGVGGWRIEPRPLLAPDQPWQEWGCEDPRITFVPETGEYVIAYTAYSHLGPGVGIARTADFHDVHLEGLVLSPENKDAALFPRRFEGDWLLVHRPVSGQTGHMWLASSPDLIHWGRPRVLLETRPPVWWDGARIGAGTQPLETDAGWLLLYHGVKLAPSGPIYRVGVALLDGEQPWRVLGRSREWVFEPEAPYERTGDVPNVVFPCGAFLRDGEVWMYYGAGDTTVGLATARLDDVLATLDLSEAPGPGAGAPVPPVTGLPD